MIKEVLAHLNVQKTGTKIMKERSEGKIQYEG